MSGIDEMVVERIVGGYARPWGVTREERMAVVVELTRRGRSAADIAGRVCVTERQVCRDRAQARREGLL